MLEAIPQSTLADVVEDRLIDYLENEGFRPGDGLPGELELSERLGVSRNVIREALSRLRMLGVVESKKRRGMIMGRPDLFKGLERIVKLKAFTRDDAADIAVLRLVIEIGMAELVYQNKSDEDIDYLQSIVDKEQNVRSRIERHRLEEAFHAHLVGMTGNKMLIRLQSLIHHYFDIQRSSRKPRSGPTGHAVIVRALKTGSQDKFRRAIRWHLTEALRFYTNMQTPGAKGRQR